MDGSAFIDVQSSSISIETGNKIFVIENDILIDIVHHKLIRNFSNSSAIEIGMNTEILGSKCFFNCELLSSITFETNSCLTRIESEAFHGSSLQSILIPSTILYRVFHPTMSISVQLWIGTGCSTSAGRGAWMETDG
jgi:hypothetical protein